MAGRVAIVCAMRQEVKSLVRGWRKVRERGLTFFESERAVVVVAGIGTAPAAMASMTLVAREQPSCLVSAGFAGALRRDLKIGDVLVPSTIVNVATGKRFTSQSPESGGTIVSGRSIAGEDRKRELREEFVADAIEMEAAGVASIADSCGLPFYAVKAISDEVDFPMPPMNEFVDTGGTFHAVKFGAKLLFRPSWWGPTRALARNSHKASMELCKALEHHIEQFSNHEQGALKPQS
ncbi:purine and other phosphorylase, family 1 [Candidatus Koribacter versatilis Ellin345]|uniref:Purine and other phosphorylase, family 1 n=1 Tax=Koribacter versatilis (strain Ellin345) TaxID=204669 RepID=Q1IQV7_KORVE|nr:5'-methylthioadenosine/S-adenosylhomocysteine nucleosidase [Candidatus Koribacter versatilis]ABF40743.1 purine and other phosphorylase, family 1 [Candidatus Koribacter versatilis Ellin345]